MKPVTSFLHERRHATDSRQTQRRFTHPGTDYHYIAYGKLREGSGGDRRVVSPPRIEHAEHQRAARVHLMTEGVFFLVLAIVVVVALTLCAKELSTFLQVVAAA